MNGPLPFGPGKRGGKTGPNLMQKLTAALEPVTDPLADVEYTDELEHDCKAETDALHAALNRPTGITERARAERDRFRDATDSEYWIAVCWPSRAEKEAALAELGLDPRVWGDKYVDGPRLLEHLRRRR